MFLDDVRTIVMFGWAATWVNRWNQSSRESNRLLARWLPCKQLVLQFYTIFFCLADCTVLESNPARLSLCFPLFWKQKIFFGSSRPIWVRSDTSTSAHSFHSVLPHNFVPRMQDQSAPHSQCECILLQFLRSITKPLVAPWGIYPARSSQTFCEPPGCGND